MEKINIPQAFIVIPFYGENEQIEVINITSFEAGIEKDPLLFDLYKHLDVHTFRPWEDKHTYIPLLLQKWERTELEIAKYFKARDRNRAMQPMIQMIKLYLAFLFWTNEQAVPSLTTITEQIQDLKIKPINSVERISYILSAPNHHHSFTQLKELFIELKKKYEVAKLKELRD